MLKICRLTEGSLVRNPLDGKPSVLPVGVMREELIGGHQQQSQELDRSCSTGLVAPRPDELIESR
jgi:hypothetical protein